MLYKPEKVSRWVLGMIGTPMSDQERTSPNNINIISSRQEMRIKKSIRGLQVDPIPNSSNSHHISCIADS